MSKPCQGCPFANMRAIDKLDAVETAEPVEMLCHESQSLDGDRPDRACVGFYADAEEAPS